MPTPAGTPTSTSGLTSNPSAFSFNFPGGSRPFVGVAIGYYDGASDSVSAVTYGGVSLTQLESFGTIAGNGRTELWGLVGGSVPTGANNVVVTTTGTLEDYSIIAFGATDVDQTTPSTALGTDGAESGAATASTALTGSLGANDWLLSYIYVFGSNPAPSDTEILELSYNGGTGWGAAQYSTDGTCNWTFASSAYVSVGVILNHDGGAAVTIEQEGFRFGLDDGSESAHTWSQSQDANETTALSTTRLLRMLVNGTGDAASTAYALRYQKNGSGGYVAVPIVASVAESYDTIAFGAIGTGANGSTTVAPSYPTGITAGQYLVCIVTSGATNSETPTTPSGWTLLATGASTDGSYGVDTGPRRVTAFGRIADGTESGTLTVSITNGGTCRGTISRFTRSGSGTWDVVGEGGNDSTSGTGVSMTMASMNWNTGDAVLVATGQRVDSATQSAQSLTASGVTFGTQTNRAATAVTTGNDHRHTVDTFAAITSTSDVDAAPTWAYTASAAASAGGVVVRLRAYTAPVTNEVYVSASSNITAGGEATTARLTAPSGKSTSDFVTGRRWDDENGTDSIDLTTDDYTEVEWCLTVQSPAADTDYYDFRVYAAAAALDTYTVTPRWTISAGGGGGTVNTETLSDTAVLIDEGLRYVLRNRLAEDAIQASDELLRQVIYRRLGDDLLSIIDEAIATYLPAGGTTYTETLSDTLVISDDMIAYLLRNRLAEDVVVVTDPSAVTTTEYNYRAESSVDVVDAEFHWMRRFRLLEESLTLVDELISALVAQAQVRTLTDTLTITDELLASRYQTAMASDSLTIIDALLSGVVRQVLTLDAIDITDSAILQRHLTRQLEDAVTIDDAVSLVFNLRRVLTDELSMTDSATATKTGYVAFYGTTRAAVGMRSNPVAVGVDEPAYQIGLAA